MHEGGIHEEEVEEGFFEGVAAGFAVTFDLLGAVLQFIFQKLGYDVRTLGGESLSHGEHGFIIKYCNPINLVGKLIILFLGLAAWYNMINFYLGTPHKARVLQDPACAMDVKIFPPINCFSVPYNKY